MDYSEFSKSFKLVNGVGPARVIQQQELDKGANRDAGSGGRRGSGTTRMP